MTKHVTIIQGHPDPNKKHFGHALADAYSNGVEEIDDARRDKWISKVRALGREDR